MGHRVVLVPGAWHGPWAWEPVVPLLRAQGLTPVTVDLPSTQGHGDMHDDAAVVRSGLDRSDEPTVLVGHSYGGLVITEAALGAACVTHLVYVCAFMMDTGEGVHTVLGGASPSWWLPDEEAGLIRVRDAQAVFYDDVDPGLCADWVPRLGTQTLASFGQSLTGAAWRDVPSTYVLTTRDRALPPEAQRTMSAHATHVVEMDTGHSPFATRPAEIVDVIRSRPGAYRL